MIRRIMFAVAVAMSLSASAAPKTQPAKPYWLDPSVNRVGTEAPRASFFAFESKELAHLIPCDPTPRTVPAHRRFSMFIC